MILSLTIMFLNYYNKNWSKFFDFESSSEADDSIHTSYASLFDDDL